MGVSVFGWTLRREADIAAQVARAVQDAKLADAATDLLSYMALVGERDSLKAEARFWVTQARELQTAMSQVAEVASTALYVEVRQRAERQRAEPQRAEP